MEDCVWLPPRGYASDEEARGTLAPGPIMLGEPTASIELTRGTGAAAPPAAPNGLVGCAPAAAAAGAPMAAPRPPGCASGRRLGALAADGAAPALKGFVGARGAAHEAPAAPPQPANGTAPATGAAPPPKGLVEETLRIRPPAAAPAEGEEAPEPASAAPPPPPGANGFVEAAAHGAYCGGMPSGPACTGYPPTSGGGADIRCSVSAMS
mmetsp:Transcript_43586/g.102736  ORF Transcript_43586/g.102736 Transcript_43586/m.102736 type:complete len:209 (+) Transcript_43586:278-904(+)